MGREHVAVLVRRRRGLGAALADVSKARPEARPITVTCRQRLPGREHPFHAADLCGGPSLPCRVVAPATGANAAHFLPLRFCISPGTTAMHVFVHLPCGLFNRSAVQAHYRGAGGRREGHVSTSERVHA